MCSFLLYSKVIYIYIYIYIYTHIFIYFSLWFNHRVLNIQGLYSRTLFIHLMYNRLHLILPSSQSTSPSCPNSVAITSLFSVSVNHTINHYQIGPKFDLTKKSIQRKDTYDTFFLGGEKTDYVQVVCNLKTVVSQIKHNLISQVNQASFFQDICRFIIPVYFA